MGDSLFSGPPELLLESVLWFCDKGEVLWWSGGPPPPVKVGSGGINPSFMRFFCFIRRFWNQIFTCVSLSCRVLAISILLARVRYLLKWNSFSNSVNIFVVKLVRPVLLTPPGLGRNPYWSGLGAVEEKYRFWSEQMEALFYNITSEASTNYSGWSGELIEQSELGIAIIMEFWMNIETQVKFWILQQDHFIGWFSHICFLVFVIFQLSTLRLESTLETSVDFTVVFSSI